MSVSIVIPVFNQLHFTKICIESLYSTLSGNHEIIVINNGSSDGTSEYLSECPNIKVITNEQNLGCAVAWNQGVKSSNTSWVAILNNDLILSPKWLCGLLNFADKKGAHIVSPAFREGEYNYDITEHSRNFVSLMHAVARMGVAQGICFMVKREVFERVGMFDEKFRIGQFEDKDFFRRAKLAGYILGTTGCSFVHHFGSLTQNMIRKEGYDMTYENENRLYFYKKWQLNRLRRFLERRQYKARERLWSLSERILYGHTLVEKIIDGKVRYF